MLEPQWTKEHISRMRDCLTMDSKGLLCAMAIDGILQHHAPPGWKDKVIESIVARAKFHELPIHDAIVIAFTYKQHDSPPDRRWKWLKRASDRGLIRLSTPLLTHLLMEASQHRFWQVSDEIVRYLQHHPEILDSTVVYQLLSVFNSKNEPEKAKRLWETLRDEDIKWHGAVLNQLLFIFVSNKRRMWWEPLIKEILNQCDLEAVDGKSSAWETPFFSTQTQLNIFKKTSQNMVNSLERWSTVDNNPDLSVMAKRWNLFVEDQITRYAHKIPNE